MNCTLPRPPNEEPIDERQGTRGRRRRRGAERLRARRRALVHATGARAAAQRDRARRAAAAHRAVGGGHLGHDRREPHARARSARAARRRAARADLPQGRHARRADLGVDARGRPLRARHARMREPRRSRAEDHAGAARGARPPRRRAARRGGRARRRHVLHARRDDARPDVRIRRPPARVGHAATDETAVRPRALAAARSRRRPRAPRAARARADPRAHRGAQHGAARRIGRGARRPRERPLARGARARAPLLCRLTPSPEKPRENRTAEHHRHLPRPEFRDGQDRHRRRRPRPRRRDAQRARARGARVSGGSRVSVPDRPGPARHRGHLAIPVSRRVLAARARDDDGDRRDRHGALGHQGQARRHARLSVARRQEPRRADGLRPRERARSRRGDRRRAPAHRRGLPRDPRAVGRAGAGEGVRRRQDGGRVRARRKRPAARGAVGHRALPAPYARAVPQGARRARRRAAPAARRASPAHADRGGAPRPRSRAVPAVLARGRDARREPGRIPADPQPHDDAARGRRGLQFDLGLQGPDPRSADRLHPRDDRARGRHHARAPHRRLRGDVPGPHGLSRRDRPVARVHGGRGELRTVGAELRHPGADAAHGADRRGVPAQLSLRRRLSRDGRRARPRRRHRRDARRELSVRARLPARRPPARRLDVELVIARRPTV
ncbi:D-mannonate dehydratase domain protein [Burkholderia pseudomallei MSHR5569]|nr:D-mannonate dehydratase domain protein [Burkholderia pseudomallei MSHR5569]